MSAPTVALHRFYRNTKRRLYCGPTAVCAVTGFDATTVLMAFEKHRGRAAFNAAGVPKGIRGSSAKEVKAVLNILGYTVIDRQVHGEPTLARYLEDIAAQSPLPRIVGLRGHFVAVGGYGLDFCDTTTKEPIPASSAPRRRARVLREIVVSEARS